MDMPGRKYQAASTSYRYGAANGQEKSTEINENSYTAEFWQYDARIGRRWNVDPIVKEFESPYATFSNNPIWFSDIKGADTTKPNKVMIDPGHGDQYKGIKQVDPGAVNGTVYEKDITKNIGTSVNKYLNEFGVTSEMTRTDDKTDAGKRITWRLQAANAANADIFVSIHADAASATASGFHVIYQEGNTNSANSKNLAESIAGVQTVMNLRGTGVDKDVRNLGVLREFNKKASVLIETGYITNESDKTILVTKADDIGKQIAIGIYKFINNGLPPSTPSNEKGIVKPIIGTVEIKRDGFIQAMHEKMLRNVDFLKPLKKQ